MPSAYYLTTDSPPNLIEFPIAERPQSTPLGRRSLPTGFSGRNLVHETEEGHIWQYRQTRKNEWRLIYRIYTEAHLQFFYDLHQAVDGAEPFSDPFYFIIDTDESPMREFLVRKRGDFLPPGLSTPTVENGNIIGVYDYPLDLIEESEAGYTLA